MVQSCLLLRGGQETSQKAPPYLPGGLINWHYMYTPYEVVLAHRLLEVNLLATES